MSPNLRPSASATLITLSPTPSEGATEILESIRRGWVDTDILQSVELWSRSHADAAADLSRTLVTLISTDATVRSSAIEVLSAIPATRPQVDSALIANINDQDPLVRQAVCHFLAVLGTEAANYQDLLTRRFAQEKEPAVQVEAITALGKLGPFASGTVSAILSLITQTANKDVLHAINLNRAFDEGLANFEQSPSTIAETAEASVLLLASHELLISNIGLDTLKVLGVRVSDQAERVAALLKDAAVQGSAAEALGLMGAKQYEQQITQMLATGTTITSQQAATAICALTKSGVPNSRQLSLLFRSDDDFIQNTATDCLEYLVATDFAAVAFALEGFLTQEKHPSTQVFAAFVLAGDDDLATEVVKAVVTERPGVLTIPLSTALARHRLRALDKALSSSADFPFLRDSVCRIISSTVHTTSWTDDDVALLSSVYRRLDEFKSPYAADVKTQLPKIQERKWLLRGAGAVGLHVGAWVCLVLWYPRSKWIQALCFWNPWVRKLLGLGYVGFLVTWIPVLRRTLFSPFKASLVAMAVSGFDESTYYPGVNCECNGKIAPMLEALSRIEGHVVLQADSGFGKTVLLQHLVAKATSTTILLTANQCEGGVIQAIQGLFPEPVSDSDLLSALIYAGGLDVCIDALNESSPTSRVMVSEFMQRFQHSNIIVATQPIEWKRPAGARIINLLPLDKDEIAGFLLRQSTARHVTNEEDYKKACESFVASLFATEESVTKELLPIVTNPLDLSVAGELIARGKKPNLLNLRQQQFDLISDAFARQYLSEFPLEPFATQVYEDRLANKEFVSFEDLRVLQCLADYKVLVLRRVGVGPEMKFWQFRHAKLRDFFVMKDFLGSNSEAVTKHMRDVRFAGVYLLMAHTLSLSDAAALREQLILDAASTGDHNVSDAFVNALRARRARASANTE